MTRLPAAQQGLVLYQNLAGKAWVAAEELNVDKLSADTGVQYLVKWISGRYLDLEITRIGKAFSEFFRRLRRRPGQSIREYNAEYDRLHARLREVGCALPEDCAAWLYVDRLQLEESAELNLLASVGNAYSLHRLQKAAVTQDCYKTVDFANPGKVQGRATRRPTRCTSQDTLEMRAPRATQRTTRMTASRRTSPRPTSHTSRRSKGTRTSRGHVATWRATATPATTPTARTRSSRL